jgi:hypothetical protein
MVLVKNDQRRRKGWQHNTTTSWDVSLDCRRNFSKVRVAAPLRDLSLSPTLARRKGKGRKLGHKSNAE